MPASVVTHLEFNHGDVFDERYMLKDLIGKGTFAQVIAVYDQQKDKQMAIKVFHKEYEHNAITEINMLQELSEGESNRKKWIIHLEDSFMSEGHVFLLFEMYPCTIYDFLKRNCFEPFPIHQIQHIGWQVANAVGYMHEMGITHSDLKLENILLVDSECRTELFEGKPRQVLANSGIKIIDLGSSFCDSEEHPKNVTTRSIRSPEMILEMDWCHPIDVWALGCILFELNTGRQLFKAKNNREHLAQMECVLGEIPTNITDRAGSALFPNGRLDWDKSSDAHALIEKKCQKLEATSKDPKSVELYSLIEDLLVYDPVERITMDLALDHGFFASLPDDLKAPPASQSGTSPSTDSEQDI